jgi:hypothetical protein
MKRWSLGLLGAGLGALFMSCRRMNLAAEEAALIALSRRWTQADLENDTTTLKSILAPEWTTTDARGRMSDRAGYLVGNRADTSERDVTQDLDSIQVRLYGASAVVTARMHESGIEAGTRFERAIRFTDVFVKRTEGWLAVATHWSRIDP